MKIYAQNVTGQTNCTAGGYIWELNQKWLPNFKNSLSYGLQNISPQALPVHGLHGPSLTGGKEGILQGAW